MSEAFLRVALACPQVGCTLRHNERPVFELAARQSPLERIALVFGRPLAESLIWVESSDGPVRLSGYVALPSQSRSNNRMQYLFLNGRSIRDRSLQHALGKAYRGLLMTGRFPIAILSLDMPPEQVDVNVHPTKLEVRFQDSSRLYSQLLSTLRTKFLGTNLVARAEIPAQDDPAAAHDQEGQARLRQGLVDWAKGQTAGGGDDGGLGIGDWGLGTASLTGSPNRQDMGPNAQSANAHLLQMTRLDRPWAAGGTPRPAVDSSRRGPGFGTAGRAENVKSARPNPQSPIPNPRAATTRSTPCRSTTAT